MTKSEEVPRLVAILHLSLPSLRALVLVGLAFLQKLSRWIEDAIEEKIERKEKVKGGQE